MEESEIEKTESNLTIDLAENGLSLIFKDYQAIIMKNLWKKGAVHSSRDAWVGASQDMMRDKNIRNSISRASVINFLNAMVDEGVLGYHEITGKGGHRRIYKPNMTEKEFWAYVTELSSEKLSNAAKSSSKGWKSRLPQL